jgi:hypothetical protein
MVSIPTTVRFEVEQLKILEQVWKSRGFRGRSEYIRDLILKDMKKHGLKRTKDFESLEKISRDMDDQRLVNRIVFSRKNKQKVLKTIEKEKLPKELAERTERNYSNVEKETLELLDRKKEKDDSSAEGTPQSVQAKPKLSTHEIIEQDVKEAFEYYRACRNSNNKAHSLRVAVEFLKDNTSLKKSTNIEIAVARLKRKVEKQERVR